MPDWRDQYEVIGPSKARVKCRLCGVELDSRAGRAQKHLVEVHGIVNWTPPVNEPDVGSSAQVPTISNTPAPVSTFPRGSREWAIELVLSVADQPGATPEQRLKAMDLLKEYESFEGAAKFDDEIEQAKHRDQWERAVKRAKELRELEKKLLRDPAVRQDVLRALKETA